MDAYIYQAALYCEDCARDIKATLTAPSDVSDETTYDSDEYPKGPYADGGGESDSPAHCDACGVFLENPLTDDGRAYVREAIKVARKSAYLSALVSPAFVRGSVALETWAPFYRLDDNDESEST